MAALRRARLAWHPRCNALARRTDNMSTSWPIVFAVFMLVAAAFYYDASNSSASQGFAAPSAPTAKVR